MSIRVGKTYYHFTPEPGDTWCEHPASGGIIVANPLMPPRLVMPDGTSKQLEFADDPGKQSPPTCAEICEAALNYARATVLPRRGARGNTGRFIFVAARRGSLYRVQITWEETDAYADAQAEVSE